MPNVLWWGTNAPKLARQKNIPPWTDDTTYTDGNENGHTWNFGLGTRLETFNQINEFAPEIRRRIVLQDGTVKIYRAGSGSSNWRGLFVVRFRIVVDTKPFLVYINDFFNNVLTTIRYVYTPKPGTATQEGMSAPSSFVVIPDPERSWNYEYLKTAEGSDLWTLGMEGELAMVGTALTQIPESAQAAPAPP